MATSKTRKTKATKATKSSAKSNGRMSETKRKQLGDRIIKMRKRGIKWGDIVDQLDIPGSTVRSLYYAAGGPRRDEGQPRRRKAAAKTKATKSTGAKAVKKGKTVRRRKRRDPSMAA